LNNLKILIVFFFIKIEILVFYLGIKSGYSSPLTLTDQSSAVKRGQKGDLQALQPHIMTSVPVRIFYFNILFIIFTFFQGNS